MVYEILKSFHLIFIVTWFAGLFYIVRLFIYYTESNNRPDPERNILINQFKIMQRRLWFGITWPSAIVTLIFGVSLLLQYDFDLPFWLMIKLLFVLGLFLYHFYCHKVYKNLMSENFIYTSYFLRILNEVASIFLVAIIFLVILKDEINYLLYFVCLSLFISFIMYSIKALNKKKS